MPTPGKPFRARRYSPSGNTRLSAPIIIAIIVGVAVIITVVIGNILNVRLDDETYDRLTRGKTTPAATEESLYPQAPRDIRVYPYVLGGNISRLTDSMGNFPAALSVSINAPSGAMGYSSPVADDRAGSSSGSSLESSMERVLEYVSYLSGVFYPTDLSKIASESLRYARTAEDASLLREFLNAGGSEVVLVGMDVSSDGITGALVYLRQVRSMLGDNARIGVAVPLEVASSPVGWQILELIREAGCFCLLDLRDTQNETLEADLLTADYYLTELELRLLITADQTFLINAAEDNVSSFQIVTAEEKAP